MSQRRESNKGRFRKCKKKWRERSDNGVRTNAKEKIKREKNRETEKAQIERGKEGEIYKGEREREREREMERELEERKREG